MELAILFWFYKDLDICVNRVQLLRKNNEHVAIYGLYGGKLEDAGHFEDSLSPYLNDFYCFTGNQDNVWKWKNGDLMIAAWYRERGLRLKWDTITVIQADMVVLDDVNKIFAGLKQDEILLSSVRKVRDVKDWWYWISEKKELYQEFYQHITSKGYSDEPVCCQFVSACLPRNFLERYSLVEKDELGFIEYRVPMYAQLFGVSFSAIKSFECWWSDDPAMKHVPIHRKTLIADKVPIPLWVILYNSIFRKKKIFHPFDYFYPTTMTSSLLFVKQIVNVKAVEKAKQVLRNKAVYK